MTEVLSPVAELALLTIVSPILKGLGHTPPPITTLAPQVGASCSSGYQFAAIIRHAIAALQRPPGRPSQRAEPTSDSHSLTIEYAVARAVRDYLIQHPGAMSGEKRYWYAKGFPRFVMGLRAPGGIAEPLSLVRFASATGVPFETLRSWNAGSRRNSSEQTEPSAHPASAEDDPESSDALALPDPPDGQLAQVKALWKIWEGPFEAFTNALANEHRIQLSRQQLVELLDLSLKKKQSPPPDRQRP